jgi:glycosyltransferase involved in cell wall biosynthesis
MIKSSINNLKVLVLEPYFGGSHKSFINGLTTHLPCQFELLTLSARKWKWRMRLSAPYYADKLKQSGEQFDRILCSTFVDVATFRGLAPEWVRKVPLLTYFHENQFVYPVQFDDERDFHFALTNVTTALASDRIAFNSKYNLDTFITGIKNLIKKSYDLKLKDPVNEITSKTKIIPPGMDFTAIDKIAVPERIGPPVIVWNHRWEHDKNPELFFKTLIVLDKNGIDFRLIVLGESFKDHPPVFEKAQKKLSKKILQFGYVNSRREYAKWLKQGDIVVSTADHEFFGMSVIEAVRAGCRPLLPNRLSYPELFQIEFLYSDDNFKNQLREALTSKRLDREHSEKLTQPYSWDSIAEQYGSWITDSQ